MHLLHDRELAAAFDHAAPAYDLFTAVAPGHHAGLRRSARRLRLPASGAGLRVLDLGCGTGASTAALLSAAPRAHITAVDAGLVLASVREILTPGGRLAVHEYTLSGAPAHRMLWTALCRGALIPAATLRGDAPLYRHLWQSVLRFDTARAFRARLRTAGFDHVRVSPATGWQWGLVHTFTGRRGSRR